MISKMEQSIEDLLKELPPVIEYYNQENDRCPIKQWANLKLTVYGNGALWYACYREPDYDGDIEHVSGEGCDLKEALISLRKELDEFPSKHKKFQWVTESEIERHKLKEQP